MVESSTEASIWEDLFSSPFVRFKVDMQIRFYVYISRG